MTSLALDPPSISRSLWPSAGTQWLPVSARIPYRFLVTYRAPAAALLPIVPAPFTLDTHAGCGFVSVCALHLTAMGVCGAPAFLRFDNYEFLYRLAVRFRGEPTFITLQSDVSSGALAFLGRHFSHYRPRRAEFAVWQDGPRRRLECTSRDRRADAVLDVELPARQTQPGSVFADADEASRFLLGMQFSADATPDGRVQVQTIDHSPWNASFADVHAARFRRLDALSATLGCPLQLDHALGMTHIQQTWRSARWA